MRLLRVNGDPGVALMRSGAVFSVLVAEPGDGVIANLNIVTIRTKTAHLASPE